MFKRASWPTFVAMVAVVAVGANVATVSASDAVAPNPRAPVQLGLAGYFAILSKSGISSVPTSAITGDIGTSPITGAAITGLTCPEVAGRIFTTDAAGPSCRLTRSTRLTTAVADMQTAYRDAAGRLRPRTTELDAGNIGGRVIPQGVHKWSSSVLIASHITINGGPNDVWIFQIAGDLRVANGMKIKVTGGATARNIFWQVAGAVIIGTGAIVHGIFLSKTRIAPNTGAVIYGRLLAQTAVTLKMNRVTQPGP